MTYSKAHPALTRAVNRAIAEGAPVFTCRSPYQRIIREVAPNGPNPAGVEACMRLNYGTLGHLPREEFQREARLAAACEAQSPGMLKALAASYGMAAEFAEWEARS